MLEKVYIDNFRSLVNFELKLLPFQLWLGENGSGKTSVLDVIRRLQKVIEGNAIAEVFSPEDLTCWMKKDKQTFSLTFLVDEEPYQYTLSVKYNDQEGVFELHDEELLWKGEPFYRYKDHEVHLYRINRNSKRVEEGTCFQSVLNRSFLSVVDERPDNKPIFRFKGQLTKCLIVAPIPVVVADEAAKESKKLMQHAENFALWYRHSVQEDPTIASIAGKYLKEVMPCYEMLSLNDQGGFRKLKVTFNIQRKSYSFEFGQLSDGQRQLIILYHLLASFQKDMCSMLVLDEPDNFVTLREIEPWWNGLNDIAQEQQKQAIIISHHPTIVNQMGDSNHAFWFSRPDGSHTQIKPYEAVEGLTPAETMERGWME